MYSNFYRKQSGFFFLLFLCLLLAFQVSYAAGSGTIKGRILGKATGNVLSGANIVVKNTSLGAASDLDGKYIIRNVPEGKQTLRISYIGYLPITVDVDIIANQELVQDFSLATQAVAGEEVVIRAQAQGQLSAINEQLSSNKIVNVVSTEKMQELPDANLAESIGRLPGVSLQRNSGEAEKVVLRGLSPKFNNVTIEGVAMNSTNYFDRSVDLSLISDELVKGVEVSKTLRPDMDADALGGTVNLTLRSAPTNFHFGIKGYGAYTDLTKNWKNYKFSGSVSNRFLDNRLGAQLLLNAEQKQLPSDQFNAGYAAPQFVKFDSATGTNVFNMQTNTATLIESKIQRRRYGASLMLDYTSDWLDVKFLNVYDQKKDSTITRNHVTNFLSNSFLDQLFVNETKTEQRTHSLQSLLRLWGTELSMTLSYIKGDAHTPNGQQFDFYQSNGVVISPNSLIFAQPSSLVKLTGVMDPSNSTLQTMYVSDANLSSKDYDAKIGLKVPFKLGDSFSGILSVGGKYHNTNRTSDRYQDLDYILYGAGANNRIDLVNSFPFLAGAYTGNSQGIPAKYFVDPNYTRTNILDYNIGPGYDLYKLLNMQNTYYPSRARKIGGLYWTNGVNDYNQNYGDKENSYAGYIMGEFNIGSRLTVVPGVRYQEEKTDFSAYHIIAASTSQNGLDAVPVLKEFTRDNPYWFPSVNMKYKATEYVQIMGAAYRSVSLPSYGDISPLVIYNATATPKITTNNPFLKPATAWNFDLGVPLFSNRIGLFTTNVFYKEITDLVYAFQNFQPFLPYPIVDAPADILDRLPNTNYFDAAWAKSNNASTTPTSIPMNNPNKAYIRGIEFSWQTRLWYMPGVLSGIVLDLNLTFIKSHTYYPSFNQVKIGGTALKPIYVLQYQTREGTIPDQPDAIYNAILGWDYKGFSSRVSFRYQKTTLTGLDTRYSLRDAYYDNVLLVDISIKQQLRSNLAVFANFTNINRHIDNFYINTPVGELPSSKQTYGMIAQGGVSFNY